MSLVGGFSGTEGEVLAAGLSAELLDEQLGKVPFLQEGAGALELEGHYCERMS